MKNIRLNYTFNGDDYTYEADYDEAVDFIRRTSSDEDIITDYLEFVYPHLDEDSKNELHDWNFYGAEQSIKNMSEDDKNDFIEDHIDEIIETDIYNDILMDHFENDAYSEYNEGDPRDEWNSWYNSQRL